VGQEKVTLLVFEFPLLLDALYSQFFFTHARRKQVLFYTTKL